MTRLRPRAGHCLVRSRDDLSPGFRSKLVVYSNGSPTRGVYIAEVIACGDGVDEVKPGDIVIVQAMSSPSGMADLRGDYLGGDRSHRLSIVPVLKRTPRAQEREHEYAVRAVRLEKSRKQWPAAHLRPPEIAAEMAEDERETKAIRASRRGRARSRLFAWSREADKRHPDGTLIERGVVAEGILAVIEPD